MRVQELILWARHGERLCTCQFHSVWKTQQGEGAQKGRILCVNLLMWDRNISVILVWNGKYWNVGNTGFNLWKLNQVSVDIKISPKQNYMWLNTKTYIFDKKSRKIFILCLQHTPVDKSTPSENNRTFLPLCFSGTQYNRCNGGAKSKKRKWEKLQLLL